MNLFLTQRRKGAKTQRKPSYLLFAPLLLCVFALNSPLAAQRIAILTPDKAETSRRFADALTKHASLRVLDNDLSEAAFRSVGASDPFNMTADEAKRAGAAIGCDFFVILKAVTQRRSAFGKADYYEAFAPIYLVSSRTGQLILWRIQTFEAAKPEAAEKMLLGSINALAEKVESAITVESKMLMSASEPSILEEVPDVGSPEAKNFRAPIPYRRVKPEYTNTASMYEVAATVEIQVDLDAIGKILRTEIVRWAGYGLDESVEKTVRAMNWRPAERNGKPLPMRFLLRYNFKKVEKE